MDLKIAIDYYKQCKDGGYQTLTEKQKQAVKNLGELMEKNGGVKLLTQNVIKWTGTISGLAGAATGGIGGAASGLAVFAVMKSMESENRIPSNKEISETWSDGNLVAGWGTIIGGIIFPPSLFATLPAMGAGNAAMAHLSSEVEKWNEKMNATYGQRDFLYEIGKKCETLVGNDRKFSEIPLMDHQILLAEASAKKLATGIYKENDVLVLNQFAASADSWFQNLPNNVDGDYRRSCVKDLVEIIKKSEINSNKTALLNNSTNFKQYR